MSIFFWGPPPTPQKRHKHKNKKKNNKKVLMKKNVMMGKRGESGRETRSVVWRGNSSKRLSFHCHIHMKAFFSFFSRGSVSDSDDQGGKKLLFLLFFRVNNKKLLKGDSERVSSARKCFCCCLHLLLLKDAKCGERERERESGVRSFWQTAYYVARLCSSHVQTNKMNLTLFVH